MRALVFDRKLEFRGDYPEPVAPPGESIVRVSVAGVCGTDLEIARGYMQYRGVPGHEFAGRVIESQNASLRGKRVVGEINASKTMSGQAARIGMAEVVVGDLEQLRVYVQTAEGAADFVAVPCRLVPLVHDG